MLVSNLANNQFVILEDNGDRHFKSYDTTVCNIIKGRIFINAGYWNNQTATTNKYLGVFLGIGTSGVKKYVESAVESKLITLTDNIKKV